MSRKVVELTRQTLDESGDVGIHGGAGIGRVHYRGSYEEHDRLAARCHDGAVYGRHDRLNWSKSGANGAPLKNRRQAGSVDTEPASSRFGRRCQTAAECLAGASSAATATRGAGASGGAAGARRGTR